MRILLVEDDDRIVDFLARGLREEGHDVTIARDGAEGLLFASAAECDVVILDLMLPILDGREICKTLRANKVNVKILILSALESTDDIVQGLRLGADDYMTKPFAFAELLARIDLLHNRSSQTELHSNRNLSVGRIELNRDSRKVTHKGRLVELAAFEFSLLEYLMLESDRIVSRDAILARVWGVTDGPKTNVVDVYIRKLRQKLFSDEDDHLISTVRGRGYRLNNLK